MKVLRLIGGLDPSHGGPAVSSMNSIIATQRAGAEITFAIPLEPSGRSAIEPSIKRLEQEGVTVVTFDCATGLEKLFPGWGVNRELASWIRQNRQDFDIVHCHGAWQMVTLLTSFSSGQRPATALTPHESLTNFDIAQSPNAVTKFLKPRLKARFLKKFDLFVMSSGLEARDSLPGDIAASPRTAIISHPVYDDTSRTLSAREAASSDTRLRLGYLGRLHQKKNLGLLIEALTKLDTNVSLTVAGTGPEEETLKAKAGALGVGNRINWLGFIHDKEAFFEQIDVLVMPSEYECFGMAAAEAIVDGIPAIVSRETGIAEIIEYYGGGQIIEPATDQIVSVIVEFLEQPDRRDALSQQAIQCAEQALSFKKHGAATVTAYQKLLERT
jgi:glycosyltransferase involved in cell wall biosynthesis